MIPKIIHRTYSSKENIPKDFEKAILESNYINKNWEYRFYDDNECERFIKEVYGIEFLKRYHKINPIYGAARADFFRYLLMYVQGGLYLDIKSISKIPLDYLIKDTDEYFLSHWENKPYEKKPYAGMWPILLQNGLIFGEFQQWFILCRPGHPFLKSVIQNVIRNIDIFNNEIVGVDAVLNVTGPIVYSLSIFPYLNNFPRTYVNIEKEMGLFYTCLDYNDYTKQTLLLKNHYSYSKEPLILR